LDNLNISQFSFVSEAVDESHIDDLLDMRQNIHSKECWNSQNINSDENEENCFDLNFKTFNKNQLYVIHNGISHFDFNNVTSFYLLNRKVMYLSIQLGFTLNTKRKGCPE